MFLKKEDINRKEIYRYLGYKGQEPDETVKELIEEVLEQLLNAIEPRYLYKLYQCKIEEADITFWHENTGECFTLQSKNLAYALRGCKEAYLMAATLGIGADKLLQRYEVISMAKASVSQACGAAVVEALCDETQEEIRRLAVEKKCHIRPRFSPGYGDLKLETQKEIFKQLDCTKRIGITLTEDMLMYPTKSVTALIGLTDEKEECHTGKCKQCTNTECEFRDEV